MTRYAPALALLLALLVSAVAAAAPPSPGTWTVFAPQRPPPVFYRPSGIAAGAGSIWVSDGAYGTVTRLSRSGHPLAGWGAPHQFSHPTAVAVAPARRAVYVAESDTGRIRILSLAGTPVASMSLGRAAGQSSSQDIVLATVPDGTAVALYGSGPLLSLERVASDGRTLARWTTRLHHALDLSYSGPFGPDPLAYDGLHPLGVAVTHSGEIDVYFQALASGGGRDEVTRSWYFVQRLSARGTLIAELPVSNASPGYSVAPTGLALTPSGDLLVPDPVSSRVLRLSPSNGRQWIAAPTSCGPLTPAGVTVDASGRILLANGQGGTVEVLSPSGAPQATWGRCLADTPFNNPFGIAVDGADNVYVADSFAEAIEKLAPNGRVLLTWPVADTHVPAPTGIALGPDGNVYVSNAASATVDVYTPDGHRLARWGGKGSVPGLFDDPQALAVAATGEVYVADSNNNRVQKLSPSGAVLAVWGGPTQRGSAPEQFDTPTAVAIGPDGDVYIADSGNSRIVVRSPAGRELRTVPVSSLVQRSIAYPQNLVLPRDGSIYVSDVTEHLLKLSPSGTLLAVWGGTGVAPGEFQGLEGLALDRNGNLYAVDRRNGRIQKLQF